MTKQLNKLILLIMLMCLLLVSCKGPDGCDLQLVAGGSKICQEARQK